MDLNQRLNFLADIEQPIWIRRRTQMEIELMVALILACSGILGMFFNTLAREDEVTCDTRNCVLVAAQVLNQVNVSGEPCEDFYYFTCGNLVNTTVKEHRQKMLMENKITKQLENLLEEPIDADDHVILNYEKQLFRACVDDKDGAKALNTLKEIFHDLGGWPVLLGSSWDEKNFNWLEWVPKFHNYDLNHMQILSYLLEIDKENPSKKLLTIMPPCLAIYKNNREMQEKILIDEAVSFGADANTARQEMTEVVNFMWKVDKISQEYINYTHPTTRVLVSEFQQIHKELDWLSYFNALMEPENAIKPDDYFSFRHGDYVKALLGLIQRTPKRIIANYMFWYVVDDLLLVLTSEAFDFHNYQECVWSSSRKTRRDICKQIIRNSFSPLSYLVAYGKKYITHESQIQATEIFNRVKKEVQMLLKLSEWMDKKDQARMIANFQTLTEGLQYHMMNYTVYEEYFKKKLKPARGFLKMYLKLKSATNFALVAAISIEKWFPDFAYFNFVPGLDPVYLRAQNTMILPVGVLQDWYYDEEKPMYINFATLGKNIAATFVKIITGVYDFQEDGEMEWSEDTKSGFERAIGCMDPNKEVNPLMLVYDDYKKLESSQIAGVKIAYNAYQGWVQENGRELPPKGVGYTSSQLFWISAFIDSCYEDDYGFNMFMHNEPVKQNSNFAKDFDCNSDSKMNPPKRCNML